MPVTREPLTINCKLNSVDILFQLNSGATISTLKHSDARAINAHVIPSNKRLAAYNGGKIELLGEANVKVFYNNISVEHNFCIVDDTRINLLGRDLCTKFNMHFVTPDNVYSNREILSDFEDFLSESFRSNIKQTVHLDVKSSAIPIFSRSRPIPTKIMRLIS